GSRMWFMTPLQVEEGGWNLLDGFRWRQGQASGRKENRASTHQPSPQKLPADGPRQHLGQQRGDGIADLPLPRGAVTVDLHVVRERLDAAEFANAEAAVLPMERSDGRTRLGLHRP